MAQRTKASASSSDNKDLKYLLSAVAACDNFAPKWQTVADEHSISYSKNAVKKFRTLVQKHGYDFENGKLVKAENDGNGDGNGSNLEEAKAALEALKKATKSKTTQTTPKKRKLGDQTAIKNENNSDDGDDN